MTEPWRNDPPEAWTDERLAAAFAARAKAHRPPVSLTDVVLGPVGAVAPRQPAIRFGRWIPAAGPIALLAVVALALQAGFVPSTGGPPSSEPSDAVTDPAGGPVVATFMLTYRGPGEARDVVTVEDRTGIILTTRLPTEAEAASIPREDLGFRAISLGSTTTLAVWAGSMCEPSLRMVAAGDPPNLRLTGAPDGPCLLSLSKRALVVEWSHPPGAIRTVDARGPLVDTAPTDVFGIEVLDVESTLQLQAVDRGDQEVAVEGWFSPVAPVSCPFTPTTSPVEPVCPDDLVVLMAEPESLATATEDGFSAHPPRGPSIQLDLDDLALDWLPPMPRRGPAVPIRLTVLGHFDDGRSTACAPDRAQVCRDRFVVDHVAWADDHRPPRSEVLDPQLTRSTWGMAQRLLAPFIGDDPILAVASLDGEGLARSEPSLATDAAQLTGHAAVWVVRVLQAERAVRYVVVDDSDAVYRIEGDRVEHLGGTPPPLVD